MLSSVDTSSLPGGDAPRAEAPSVYTVGEPRTEARGDDSGLTVRSCKNERCHELVPPTKNPGRPRLFCSIRCKVQHHSRVYYARNYEYAPPHLQEDESGETVGFYRRRVKGNAELAEGKYRKHVRSFNECRNSSEETGGYCPGRDNREFLTREEWQQRRGNELYPGRCLIAATFQDDWLQARSESLRTYPPYQRRWTFDDGQGRVHWLNG